MNVHKEIKSLQFMEDKEQTNCHNLYNH